MQTPTTVVRTANRPEFGNYLTDATGRTLYIYTKDPANQSVCTNDDNCIQKWPSLLAPVGFVSSGELGTITRPNGSSQITYNRWPLYYYYLDVAPGDAKGQSEDGVWYVIQPDGHPFVTHYTSSDDEESYIEVQKSGVDYANFHQYYLWRCWVDYAVVNRIDINNEQAYRVWINSGAPCADENYIRNLYNQWILVPWGPEYNSWNNWGNWRGRNRWYGNDHWNDKKDWRRDDKNRKWRDDKDRKWDDKKERHNGGGGKWSNGKDRYNSGSGKWSNGKDRYKGKN